MIPKFRFYDKKYKIWLKPECVWLDENGNFRGIDGVNRFESFDDKDIVLTQSTGMFDKNGVEIFEGDVVIAWSQGVKGTFEIKRRIDGLWLLYPAWKNGQFWYLSPTEDGRETIEVIGNIYDLERVEE